ncbi:MAG: class I SAM-dependent methyltransferase [Candidatus Thiodiazotropha sp.]
MKSNHSVDDYNKLVKRMLSSKDKSKEKAMAESIGGNFIPFGLIMRNLLLRYGLKSNDTVCDIGCGSGRLAFALKEMSEVTFVGIDVVEDLLIYADQLCMRQDWEFHKSTDFKIPLPDDSVDMVTAFSVFTHLLHEESFMYLCEAQRVLKPSGKVVFSFLDFSIHSHWAVFRSNIDQLYNRVHLNQFLHEEAIRVWCGHLNLNVVDILPGDVKNIPLREPVTLEDGTVEKEYAALGQSICVLEKPAHEDKGHLDPRLPVGFNPELYLLANPDVARANQDPVEHYLAFGKNEGRRLRP